MECRTMRSNMVMVRVIRNNIRISLETVSNILDKRKEIEQILIMISSSSIHIIIINQNNQKIYRIGSYEIKSKIMIHNMKSVVNLRDSSMNRTSSIRYHLNIDNSK